MHMERLQGEQLGQLLTLVLLGWGIPMEGHRALSHGVSDRRHRSEIPPPPPPPTNP